MTRRKIRKLLVANRGEIAVRVFHTCRELGIATVAVYSEADLASPHRFAADESVCIGPAPARQSYLVAEKLIDAARSCGADAIHPGYGFLSENAQFAAAVEQAGLIFVGPTPEQILMMGDKVRARLAMEAAGVPLTPGSRAAITDERELLVEARRLGFPLLVKAAGGGGGKGIRQVVDESELRAAWQRAASEAGAAFGDRRVYLERLVVDARHIEGQLFGDGHGGALFFGERECSLQRNHQKILEESPSAALDDEVRNRLREAVLAGTRALRYRGAGTMEFLFDESRRELYFLEMNTRLQVEHPVTEMVTRTDLVALQIRIAEGERLDGVTEPVREGHSIEYRVYAEDAYRGFQPSTGVLRVLRLPHAPFVRIDAALREGWEISPYYDPLLAKVIVWAPDRAAAIRRLETALSRTRIGGVHTTIPLGIEICRWPEFLAGRFHTRSIEAWLAQRRHLPTAPPPLAVRLAGLVAREALRVTSAPSEVTHDPSGGAWGAAARLAGTNGTAR